MSCLSQPSLNSKYKLLDLQGNPELKHCFSNIDLAPRWATVSVLKYTFLLFLLVPAFGFQELAAQSPSAGVFSEPEKLESLLKQTVLEEYILEDQLLWPIVQGVESALKNAEFSQLKNADGSPQVDEFGRPKVEPYSIQRLDRVAIGSSILNKLVQNANGEYQSFRDLALEQYEQALLKISNSGDVSWIPARILSFQKILEDAEAWELVIDYQVEVRPFFDQVSLDLKASRRGSDLNELSLLDATGKVSLNPVIYVKSILGQLENSRTNEVIDLDLFEQYNEEWELAGVEVESEAYADFSISSSDQIFKIELAPLPDAETQEQYKQKRPVRSNLKDPSAPVRLNEHDVDVFMAKAFGDPMNKFSYLLGQLLPSMSPQKDDFLSSLLSQTEASQISSFSEKVLQEAEEVLKQGLAQQQIFGHIWLEKSLDQDLKLHFGVTNDSLGVPEELSVILNSERVDTDLLVHMSSLMPLKMNSVKSFLDLAENKFSLELELPEILSLRWRIHELRFPLVLFESVESSIARQVLESLQGVNLAKQKDVFVRFDILFDASENNKIKWTVPWVARKLPESKQPILQFDIDQLKVDAPVLRHFRLSPFRLSSDSELVPLVLSLDSSTNWEFQLMDQFPAFIEQAFGIVPEATLESLYSAVNKLLESSVSGLKADIDTDDLKAKLSVGKLNLQEDAIEVDWVAGKDWLRGLRVVDLQHLDEEAQSRLQSARLIHEYALRFKMPESMGANLSRVQSEKADIYEMDVLAKTQKDNREIFLIAGVFIDYKGQMFSVILRHNFEKVLGGLAVDEDSFSARGIVLNEVKASSDNPKGVQDKLVDYVAPKIDRTLGFGGLFGQVFQWIAPDSFLGDRVFEPIGKNLVQLDIDWERGVVFPQLRQTVINEVNRLKYDVVDQMERQFYNHVNGDKEKSDLGPLRGLQRAFSQEVNRVEGEIRNIHDRAPEISAILEEKSKELLNQYGVNQKLAELYIFVLDNVADNITNIPQQAGDALEGNPSYSDYQAVREGRYDLDASLEGRADIFALLRGSIGPSLLELVNLPILAKLRPEQYADDQNTLVEEEEKAFPLQFCLFRQEDAVLSQLGLLAYFEQSVNPDRDLISSETDLQSQNKNSLEAWMRSNKNPEADLTAFLDLQFVQEKLLEQLPAMEQALHEVAKSVSGLTNKSLRIFIENPKIEVESLIDQEGKEYSAPVLTLDFQVMQDTRLIDGVSYEDYLKSLQPNEIEELIELYSKKHITERLEDKPWLDSYISKLLQDLEDPEAHVLMTNEEFQAKALYVLRRLKSPREIFVLTRLVNAAATVGSLFLFQLKTGEKTLRVPLEMAIESNALVGEEGYSIPLRLNEKFVKKTKSNRGYQLIQNANGFKSIASSLVLDAVEEALLEPKTGNIYTYFFPTSIGLPFLEQKLPIEILNLDFISSNDFGTNGAVLLTLRINRDKSLNNGDLDLQVKIFRDKWSEAIPYLNEFLSDQSIQPWRQIESFVFEKARELDLDITKIKIKGPMDNIQPVGTSNDQVFARFQVNIENSLGEETDWLEFEIKMDFAIIRFKESIDGPYFYHPYIKVSAVNLYGDSNAYFGRLRDSSLYETTESLMKVLMSSEAFYLEKIEDRGQPWYQNPRL